MSERPGKRKRGMASSPKVRQVPPNVPPLFYSDPEKNFSQWVKNCFPDTAVAREEAIRQWLTSPLESRVQNVSSKPAESAKPNASPTPAAPSQEAGVAVASSKAAAPTLTGGMGWPSKQFASEQKASKGGNFSTLLTKLGAVSVAVILVVVVWRAVPIAKGISQAATSVEANAPDPDNAGPAQDPGPPAAEADNTAGTPSDSSASSTAPTTIEHLSVGCMYTQPCVQFSTRGKVSLPKVTALTNPNRVIMDFPDAVLSSSIQGIEVEHGAVKDVRIGEKPAQPFYTRVVIDLTEQCDYELLTVTNGIVLKFSPGATPRQTGL